MLEFPRSWKGCWAGPGGGAKVKRLNAGFDIRTSLPQEEKKEKKETQASDQQQEVKVGGGARMEEYNQLPVQSPPCRLTQATPLRKPGLHHNRVGGVE